MYPALRCGCKKGFQTLAVLLGLAAEAGELLWVASGAAAVEGLASEAGRTVTASKLADKVTCEPTIPIASIFLLLRLEASTGRSDLCCRSKGLIEVSALQQQLLQRRGMCTFQQQPHL